MAISPGTYLRKRREAAGLSCDDVALRTETAPPVSARARAEWLRLIEADQAPVGDDAIAALAPVFGFDREVLERLIDLYACGADLPEPRLCRNCACSFLDPCVDAAGNPCAWAREDLCTACAPNDPTRAAAALPVPDNDRAGTADTGAAA